MKLICQSQNHHKKKQLFYRIYLLALLPLGAPIETGITRPQEDPGPGETLSKMPGKVTNWEKVWDIGKTGNFRSIVTYLLEYNISNSVQQQLWITSKVWFIKMLKKIRRKKTETKKTNCEISVHRKAFKHRKPRPESRTQNIWTYRPLLSQHIPSPSTKTANQYI